MFAPKVAKPQTKAGPISKNGLAPARSGPVAHRTGNTEVELPLFLQRTISNQATLRLLAQRAAGPTAKEPGGDHKQEATPESITARDAPRDKLMRMRDPEPLITAAPPRVSPKCITCEEQTQLAARSEDAAGEAPGIVHEVLRSSGQPLDTITRTALEPRLGYDFRRVQVHSDQQAAAAAHALGARAFTVAERIVFAKGAYAPHTREGCHLLAHELTHVAQQMGGTRKRLPSLGILNDFHEREADQIAGQITEAAVPTERISRPSPAPFSIQRQVSDAGTAPETLSPEAQSVHDAVNVPDPIAGVGDFPRAFQILDGLDVDVLLRTLGEIPTDIELLRGNAGMASDRVVVAILAIAYRRDHTLPPADMARVQSAWLGLAAGDQSGVRQFLLRTMDEHEATIFTSGEPAEVDRLAKLQAGFWEKQRQDAEARAKKDAEAAAKKSGLPPPSTAPTVSADQSIKEQAAKRGFGTHPVDRWTSLSPADKDAWTNKRAPAAWAAAIASIKGTELEKVMTGKTFKFDPVSALQNGWYAWQSGNVLNFGMGFVENVEADPKNVWPLLAHEMGGHFEYGQTYTVGVINKAVDLLPEPARTEMRKPANMKALFDAYEYSETEIFSALRQKRYDDPVSGPKPTHGALLPDANITGHLEKIKTGFPPEVGKAILIELWKKVNAATEILDRDKAYFHDKVHTMLGFDL